jgi:predicted  nucleic acid-binding Zn-ribbon protein
MAINPQIYKKKGESGYLELYAICSICGKEYTRPNIQVSKYCSDCSNEIRKKKVAENMKAYRKRKALNEKKAIND